MTSTDMLQAVSLPGKLTITDPDIIMCLSGYDPQKFHKFTSRLWQGRGVRPLMPTQLPKNSDEEAAIGIGSNISLLARRLFYWQRTLQFVTNDTVINMLERDVKEIGSRLRYPVDKADKKSYLRGVEQLEIIYDVLMNSDASRERVTMLGKGLHALYKKLWVDVLLDDDDLIRLIERASRDPTARDLTSQPQDNGIKEHLKESVNAAIDEIIHVRLEAGEKISESEIGKITEGLAKQFKVAETVEDVEKIKSRMVNSIKAMVQVREMINDASSQDIPVEFLNTIASEALSGILRSQTPEQIFNVVTQAQVAIQRHQEPKPILKETSNHDSPGVITDPFLKAKSTSTISTTKALPAIQSTIELGPSSLINMAWLFGMTLNSEQQDKVKAYAESLYVRSQSQKKLDMCEWSDLAKAWLLTEYYDDVSKDIIENLVIRFFLCHRAHFIDAANNSIRLPREFKELLKASGLESSVLDMLRYHNQIQVDVAQDPNGYRAFKEICRERRESVKPIQVIKKTAISDLPMAIRQMKLLKIKPLTDSSKKNEIDKILRDQREVIENLTNALAISLCWNDSVNMEDHWEKIQQLIESMSLLIEISAGAGNEAAKALQVFDDVIDMYNRKVKVDAVPCGCDTVLQILKNRLRSDHRVFSPEETRYVFEYGLEELKNGSYSTNPEEMKTINELAEKLLRHAEVINQKVSLAAKAAHAFQLKYSHEESRNAAKSSIGLRNAKPRISSPISILTSPREILNQQKILYDQLLAPELVSSDEPLLALDGFSGALHWKTPTSREEALANIQAFEGRLNEFLAKAARCRIGDVSLKYCSDIVRGRFEGVSFSGQFGRYFKDRGLAVLRDFVYPYIICDHMISSMNEGSHVSTLEPASAADLAALIPDQKEQVGFLLGLIQGMDTILGGGSVRADSQVKMLQKCIEAVKGDKTVLINAKPGSGKSTIVRLFGRAFPIGNTNLSAIIHVAPFAQDDPNWKPLKDFNDLPTAGKEPTHFSITAEGIETLLKQAASSELLERLKNCLFINDEYDHPEYRNVLPKLISLGCKRHVNISATGSLLHMENRINHWNAKIAWLRKWIDSIPAEQRALRKLEIADMESRMARYTKNRVDMESYKASLQQKMEMEFRYRNIEMCQAGVNEDETLFAILAEVNQSSQSPGSFLIEVPYLNEIDPLKIQESLGAPSVPTVILCRELSPNGIGTLMAYQWSMSSRTWKALPFEEYKKEHEKMTSKPKVICIYTKDSTGGDFENFSRMKSAEMQDTGVASANTQYIVFGDQVTGFQQVYQNLSRLRRSGDDVSLLPPVKIYLGASLWKELKHKQEMDVSKVQSSIKEQFFLQAYAKAGKEEIADEELHLQEKIKRKTESALRLMVNRYCQDRLKQIVKQASFKSDHPWIKQISNAIDKIIKETDHFKMDSADNMDIEKVAKNISKDVWKQYLVPSTFIHPKHQKEVQVAEGMCSLSEKYFPSDSDFQSGLSNLSNAILACGAEMPFAKAWPIFVKQSLFANREVLPGVCDEILSRLRTPLGNDERERLGNRKLKNNVVMEEMIKPSPGKSGILRILTAWDMPSMALSLKGLRNDEIQKYRNTRIQIQDDQRLRTAISNVDHFEGLIVDDNSVESLQMRANMADMRARIDNYATNLTELQTESLPIKIHEMQPKYQINHRKKTC